jgi:hypothetical protein
VLFSVAQLDAAATRHSFMARAIARRGGDALQPRGRIAIDGYDRQQREDKYSGQANVEGAVGNDGQKQRVHASCCGDSAKKPIALLELKNHY